MGAVTLEAPTPLTDAHETTGFDCGVESLNIWLTRRAWANQVSGASRTYVVTAAGRIEAVRRWEKNPA